MENVPVVAIIRSAIHPRRASSMPFIRIVTLLAVAVVALAWSRPATAQCLPADSTAASVRRYLTRIATEPTEQIWVSMRSQHKIPQVAASQVAQVSTSRICSSALNVYKTRLPAGYAPPMAVYVVSVGWVYAVWVPPAPGTEWMRVVVMDSKNVVLSEFAR
jgi:hypothetical protein